MLFATGCVAGVGLALSMRRTEPNGEPDRALQWSERYYRSLIENSSDIISLIDAKGTILYKSSSLNRILGFGPQELIGRNAFEVAHPDDRPFLMAMFIRLLNEPSRTLIGEFRHLHKDGTYRWMEGIAANRLADPAVKAIVFNYRDITARKEAEATLLEAKVNLRRYASELEQRVAERTARLEKSVHALEGVLYHVAHDLRAPVRAMHGYTSMLLEHSGSSLDDEGRDYFDRISEATVRMDALISGLLEYGRLGHVELASEPVNLGFEMGTVLGQLREKIQSKQAEIIVAEPLLDFWAHPHTLQQVLLNLLDNGLKFVAPGVTPRIRIWTEPQGKRVRLCIQDNGIGVPLEYQDKIFQVFERLYSETSFPGVGIGLAIVHEGVERMGGKVGLISKSGGGSCFWLELPAANPQLNPAST